METIFKKLLLLTKKKYAALKVRDSVLDLDGYRYDFHELDSYEDEIRLDLFLLGLGYGE